MQFKKYFRDYQGLIISACILIACLLGVLLGIVPLAQKAFDLNKEITSLSSQVGELRNKVSVLQGMDEDVLRSNVQTLLSAVPSDVSLPTLLNTIDGLAAQTGVSTGVVSLAKPGSLATTSAQRASADEKSIGSNISPFTISITGTLDQIQSFLTQAVSVRRAFRIRSYEISSTNDLVSANMLMEAFWYPIPSSIGSVTQPITALTSSDDDLIAKVAAMPLLAGSSGPPVSAAPGAGKVDPFSF